MTLVAEAPERVVTSACVWLLCADPFFMLFAEFRFLLRKCKFRCKDVPHPTGSLSCATQSREGAPEA